MNARPSRGGIVGPTSGRAYDVICGEQMSGADEVASVDYDSVRAVNHAFYEAFEAGEADRLLGLWEHSARVQCTHPGWSILRGWDDVGGSWSAILEAPDRPQFVLTNEHIEVKGDVAWVTIDENILAMGGSATVSAMNVFVRTDGEWKIVGHHGSMVMQGR